MNPPGRFVCPRCGKASSHPTDMAEGYCGACHDWTVRAGADEGVEGVTGNFPRPRPVAPLSTFERRGILVAAALMIPPGALALLLGWPWHVTLPGTALVAAVMTSRLIRSWRIRHWENVAEASGLLVFIVFAVIAGFGHGWAIIAAPAVALPTVLWMAWTQRRDERHYRAHAERFAAIYQQHREDTT